MKKDSFEKKSCACCDGHTHEHEHIHGALHKEHAGHEYHEHHEHNKNINIENDKRKLKINGKLFTIKKNLGKYY